MILPKQILINMLTEKVSDSGIGLGYPSHWVAETITTGADALQLILIPASKRVDEPFPGLTKEILEYVQSDAVSHIHSVVTDQTRKAVNIILTPTEEPHVSVPE